jgi:hypothetical protein
LFFSRKHELVMIVICIKWAQHIWLSSSFYFVHFWFCFGLTDEVEFCNYEVY